MEELKSYQKRLIWERNELMARLSSLNAFTKSEQWSGLDNEQQLLIAQQGVAMAQYGLILDQRIASFA